MARFGSLSPNGSNINFAYWLVSTLDNASVV
jgi:hypothetical protein